VLIRIVASVLLLLTTLPACALSIDGWEKIEAASAANPTTASMRLSYLQGIADTLNVLQNSQSQIQLNEAVTVIGGGGFRRRICLPSQGYLFNASHIEAAIKNSLSNQLTVKLYQATYGESWRGRLISKVAVDGLYDMFPCKE
jgi:hypothetical protein